MTTTQFSLSQARLLAIGLLLSLGLGVQLTGCASDDAKSQDEDVMNELADSSSGNSDAAPAKDAPAAEGSEASTEKELDEFGAQEEKTAQANSPADQTAPLTDDFSAEEKAQPTEPAPAPVAEQPAVAPAPAPMVAAPTNNDLPNTVTAIHFLASSNGGTIEIKTTQPAKYTVRTNASANQTVIEVSNAKLASQLQRPFIMKDFDTPFGAINAYQNSGGSTARIVVQMKGAGDPVVSQQGNAILLTPGSAADIGPGATQKMAEKPAPPKSDEESIADEEVDNSAVDAADKESYNVKEARRSEKILGARTLDEFLTGSGKFFGRPISLQTNDADIRDVISFIAEESGVNIVIADDVDGKISLKLRQVPWDQALVIVMRSKGLGYVRQGNVLRITKLATLQLEAKAAKEIVDAQNKLTPVKVKVIPVSYANVTDLEKQVKPFLTETRGQVVSDTRTSSIVLTDTAEVLERVSRLIKELDIPPAQVMIEGKVVEATETFSRNIGVNWGFSGVQNTLSQSGGNNGSPINYQTSLAVSPLAANQTAAGAINFNIGVLNFVGNLNAALSLAQTDSLVRIISSPRIVTMNKEKAEISQTGETIYINQVKDNTTQTITSQPQSKPIELRLTVTPQITAEGSVVLDVKLKRQFVGAVADPISGAAPINTREAQTKVLVPNGQTAVIGGIYQSDETDSETGIPVLKSLPFIGWLFKATQSNHQKNELLLFLTPRILNARDQTASTTQAKEGSKDDSAFTK